MSVCICICIVWTSAILFLMINLGYILPQSFGGSLLHLNGLNHYKYMYFNNGQMMDPFKIGETNKLVNLEHSHYKQLFYWYL